MAAGLRPGIGRKNITLTEACMNRFVAIAGVQLDEQALHVDRNHVGQGIDVPVQTYSAIALTLTTRP